MQRYMCLGIPGGIDDKLRKEKMLVFEGAEGFPIAKSTLGRNANGDSYLVFFHRGFSSPILRRGHKDQSAVRKQLGELLTDLLQKAPKVHILCHNYSSNLSDEKIRVFATNELSLSEFRLSFPVLEDDVRYVITE